MGHPAIDNQPPFVFEPLFLADEDDRPVITPLVKGALSLEGHRCTLRTAERVRLGHYLGV